MKNIIITGANGFIGSLLTDRFLREGYCVFAIVRDKRKMKQVHPNLTVFSYDDIQRLEEKADGAVFYHLAWQGVNGADKGSMEIQLNNIRMTMQAAETAKRAGCTKFLCAGSIAERSLDCIEKLDAAADGMMYAAAKRAARCMLEVYCKNTGLNLIWMQFSNVYGPSNKTGNLAGYVLGQILNGKEALVGPALQPYDLIYIDDLIEAVFCLGIKKTRKQFYFIGSGRPRPLASYLQVIGEVTGKSGLIKIGARADDGIQYSMDMFSAGSLAEDIGDYSADDFEISIRKTVRNYFDA